MRIKKISIYDAGPFRSVSTLELRKGFNIIIGQNNSGKSFLLKCLLSNFDPPSHRGPKFDGSLPRLSIEFDIDDGELRETIARNPGRSIRLRVPFSISEGDSNSQIHANELLNAKDLVVKVDKERNTLISDQEGPGHNAFTADRFTDNEFYLPDKNLVRKSIVTGAPLLSQTIHAMWHARAFYFTAQRYSVGKSPYGRDVNLNPDIANLAIVLATLQGERGSLFERLVQHVRDIFSTVGNLSVANTDDGFEVRIWPTSDRSDPELSFSLDQSGSGIAQVVSILTIAITRTNAIVVIDEINSFLHPQAIKTLIRIINTFYPNNQYIVSTHALEVIANSDPSSMYIVKKTDYESHVKEVFYNDRLHMREISEELGVDMADVFAANKVIWVEGQTEEACFEFLVNRFKIERIRGCIFVAVVATGDFQTKKRNRDLVFDVYNRLTTITSPIATEATFSFDREKLTDAEIKKIEGEVRNLHILPQRHYECYLISPDAIHDVILHTVPDYRGVISVADVENKLKILANSVKYEATSEWNGDLEDTNWSAKVNAAKMIADCISSLTEARMEYDKVRHSLHMTRYISENQDSKIKDLVDYIKTLL